MKHRKMIRRILSLVLSLTMLFIFSPFALAATTEAAQVGIRVNAADVELVSSYSEYDQILELQSQQEDELLEMGFTSTEIKELYAFDYEKALLERAQLPDAQLAAMGYSQNQIQLLQDFANGEASFDDVAPLASATCTGFLIRENGGENTSGKEYVTISYSWVWSSCPLVRLTDRAAMGYIGIDESGSFKAIKIGSSSCTLTSKYALEDGSVVTTTITKVDSFEVNEYGATCTYDMGDYLSSYWISGGRMTVELIEEGSYDMRGVYAIGKIAHKTVTGSVTPGVTFGSSLSAAVTFSTTTNIDTVAIVSGYRYCTL